MRKRVIVAGTVVAVALGAGGTAVAGSLADNEEDVTGPLAERAEEAALEATGGGTANSVERDTEDGATWEVEVTKRDGSTVDVRLDEAYEVVVIEEDDEGADSDD